MIRTVTITVTGEYDDNDTSRLNTDVKVSDCNNPDILNRMYVSLGSTIYDIGAEKRYGIEMKSPNSFEQNKTAYEITENKLNKAKVEYYNDLFK